MRGSRSERGAVIEKVVMYSATRHCHIAIPRFQKRKLSVLLENCFPSGYGFWNDFHLSLGFAFRSLPHPAFYFGTATRLNEAFREFQKDDGTSTAAIVRQTDYQTIIQLHAMSFLAVPMAPNSVAYAEVQEIDTCTV